MQYYKHPIEHYALEVKVLEDRHDTKMYKRLHVSEIDVKDIDFNPDPEKLRLNYLCTFEGVKSDIFNAAKYDMDCDIGTAYMGISYMRRHHDLNRQYKLLRTEDCYMDGRLLVGTNCRILLDTGLSPSCLRNLYQNCLSFHSLPKFSLRTKSIMVGNGQHISVLFIIPFIVNLHGHRF